MLRYFIALGAFFASASVAQAECITVSGASCGPASSYEITIDKVEFCKSAACSSPVVVASTSTEFDIADASAGGAVGNYADLDDVAAGVYTHIRTTIDGTITYAAAATGSCSAVPAGTSTAVTGITGLGAALAASANTDFNLSLSSPNLIHTYELSTPLTISKAASLPQVQIDFATADGHLCIGSASYPGVPFVDITVINN